MTVEGARRARMVGCRIFPNGNIDRQKRQRRRAGSSRDLDKFLCFCAHATVETVSACMVRWFVVKNFAAVCVLSGRPIGRRLLALCVGAWAEQ